MNKPAITAWLVASLCASLVTATAIAAETQQPQTEAGFSSAYQAAARHDPELRTAYLNFKAEQQEAPLAFGRLLPSISLNAGYSYEDSENHFTENPSITPDPRSDGKIHENHWGINLDQPLFNLGIWRNYQAAQHGVTAATYRYTEAERELMLRVTSTYLQLLFAARQEYLYQQQLHTIQLQIDQAQRQQDLGIGDRITQLEILAQQDLVRADLLEARSRYSDARTLLENMTGKAFEAPSAWRQAEHQPLPDTNIGTEEEWTKLTLSNLSYQQAQSRVNQAARTVDARRAEHYPTVNLNLSYINRDSDDIYRTREGYRLGIDLNLPIYHGGRTQAALRQADARMQAEHARSDQALAEALQQVRLNYSRLTSLSQRLEALHQSEASTRSFLAAAQRGQQLNLRSRIDVLDAQNRLLDVQLRYAEALKNYLEADLQLHHAVGHLTTERLKYFDALFNQAAETRTKHPHE